MDHSIKTRLLKKYEAADSVAFTAAGDPQMDFYTPFGPMIAKVRLAPELIDRLNTHIDTLIPQGQGRERVLAPEFCAEGGDQSLARQTAQLITRYLAGMEDARVSRVEFEHFWVVSQYAGTPSPTHFHTGDISGVMYLRTPRVDPGEEQKSYISGRQAGYINFLIGGKQRFSKSLISFRPEAGDFYLFPGWLLHAAEPFRGSGERRSLAFNAFVTTAPE
jgi:hypothetical protein